MAGKNNVELIGGELRPILEVLKQPSAPYNCSGTFKVKRARIANSVMDALKSYEETLMGTLKEYLEARENLDKQYADYDENDERVVMENMVTFVCGIPAYPAYVLPDEDINAEATKNHLEELKQLDEEYKDVIEEVNKTATTKFKILNIHKFTCSDFEGKGNCDLPELPENVINVLSLFLE